jgi:hypothetical protein
LINCNEAKLYNGQLLDKMYVLRTTILFDVFPQRNLVIFILWLSILFTFASLMGPSDTVIRKKHELERN